MVSIPIADVSRHSFDETHQPAAVVEQLASAQGQQDMSRGDVFSLSERLFLITQEGSKLSAANQFTSAEKLFREARDLLVAAHVQPASLVAVRWKEATLAKLDTDLQAPTPVVTTSSVPDGH